MDTILLAVSIAADTILEQKLLHSRKISVNSMFRARVGGIANPSATIQSLLNGQIVNVISENGVFEGIQEGSAELMLATEGWT